MHNPARTLIDQIWGADWINAIPLKFRSTLKYLNLKTPGVDNAVQPDEIGVDGIINSQVVTNRINEREKTTSKLDGSVTEHVYHDQDYDEVFDVVVPVDRYLTPEGAEFGEPRRKIEGLTPGIDSVETIGVDTTVLDNFLLEFPGTTTIRTPDILTSFSVLEESTVGDGAGYGQPILYGFGGDHSITLNFNARAQASAAFVKEVVPFITPMDGITRTVTNYMFLLPMPVHRDDVTTRLAALTGISEVAWPNFKPNHVTFVIVSRRVSLDVNGGYTLHDSSSFSGSSAFVAKETHSSREVGLSVKTVRLPPTIHGDLTGSGSSGGIITHSPDTTAEAHIPNFLWAGTFGWGFDVVETDQAWSKIYAFGLEATSGDTTLPTSGLLIVSSNARPYKYGYAMIQVEAVDASTLA